MGKIHIKNLGPITDVNLDLSKDMCLVIGPQATGKSTMCKIIYFCKMIRFYFVEFLYEDTIIMETPQNELYLSFLKYIRKKYMSSFGTTKHMSRYYYVKYEYGENTYVTLKLDEQGYVKFNFSLSIENELKKAIMSMRKLYEDIQKDTVEDAYTSINRKVQTKREAIQHFVVDAERIFQDNEDIIYIPAGRSLLSVLSDQLDIVNTMGLDLPMRDFIERIRDTKHRFGTRLDNVVADYVKTIKGQIQNTDVELAKQLIQKILKAEYVNDIDGEKLYIDDKHWVKLIYGSSGQQEALWIVLLLFIVILENKKTFVIVEEPEAHLYPIAQRHMMELLALTMNSSGSHLLITTHSPYIMTSSNLLLYSAKVENQIKQAADQRIIMKQYRISPDQMSAYKFGEEHEETFYDIIDKETGLINASEIDTISDIITEETDKLIDMEIRYGL